MDKATPAAQPSQAPVVQAGDASAPAVRMLTGEELADCVPVTASVITKDGVDVGVLLTPQELKSFGENYKKATSTIPADGVIGGAA